MKFYVQFTEVKDNKIIEKIGSDGVFILDGRNNLRTMKCDAIERAYRLRNVQNIDGYKIMRGTRFDNSVCVYEWLRSGARAK